MTPGEGGAKDINIPVFMININSLEKLRKLVKDSPVSSAGLLSRMVVP